MIGTKPLGRIGPMNSVMDTTQQSAQTPTEEHIRWMLDYGLAGFIFRYREAFDADPSLEYLEQVEAQARAANPPHPIGSAVRRLVRAVS